ncbi:MAG: uracil phosphoribosyltransferase [Alphaproteobacteria bacterium]|jgi:uracil phosphoribosyltransferase
MTAATSRFANLRIVDHPLVSDKLAVLRSKTTPPVLFRRLVHELTWLIGAEATRDLALAPVSVDTGLATFEAQRLAMPPAIVSILRAGLGMAEPLQELIPDAVQGHVGLYRDEETLQPVHYYRNLPDMAGRTVLLVDPMLATAGSANAAIDLLNEAGVADAGIRLLVLLAAPEGVAALAERHPQVSVTAAALDDHLDARGYIVPGLGDAGDRYFGTL